MSYSTPFVAGTETLNVAPSVTEPAGVTSGKPVSGQAGMFTVVRVAGSLAWATLGASTALPSTRDPVMTRVSGLKDIGVLLRGATSGKWRIHFESRCYDSNDRRPCHCGDNATFLSRGGRPA